jgi:hypothetical protein
MSKRITLIKDEIILILMSFAEKNRHEPTIHLPIGDDWEF